MRHLGLLLALPLAASTVRIIQTNSAGDNVHIIDPATNKVVGVINGIEVSHGAAVAPDGSRYYISNEAESTLDVVDQKTLKVTKSIPLSGHPNNISISKDGRRVYVAIAVAPGAVDVIDTTSLEKVKSIPVKGAVHNTYVTPDGKYVVSGSIPSKTITVIDAKTETPVWSLEMDLGIRPMAFATNPDGTTKWIFVQLSGFNGFAVVDFATHKEIKRIKLPDLPAGKSSVPGGRERVARHGGHLRWKDAGGQQQTEQRDLLVLASRLEASRQRRCGAGSGLGDAHAGRQDGLRGQRRVELGIRGRHQVHERDHAHSGRTGSQAEHHGGTALTQRLA